MARQARKRIGAGIAARGAYCELGDLLRLRSVAGTLKLSPPSRAISQLSGPVKSNFRGRGIEFEEVRCYEPGDDVRNIDWRVTARTGTAHTKMFREERERPVYILVDQRPGMFFGSRETLKSVQAVHAAALLAWSTLAGGDRVGGLVLGDGEHHEIRPRRSRRAVMELLRLCHDFNARLGAQTRRPAAEPSTLGGALATMRRVVRPGSLVFVLSDFADWDESAERQIHLLARRAEIAAICVTDPLEIELPAGGRCSVSDGRLRRELDLRDGALRQRYHEHFLLEQQRLRGSLRRIGAPLIALTTADSALDTLARFYRGGRG